MNDQQWQTLLSVVRGESLRPLPTGFIIDCPWLPGWRGHSILDYFTDDRLWLEDNLAAVREFPETLFLPGFWAEYGMCTEPSAFGSVNVWEEDEFPFAKTVLHSLGDIEKLEAPNPRKHGLLPFVVKRLQHALPAIEAEGHAPRFAVARGPLNIASFLVGTTEFLTALRTDPELMHRLLTVATDFLVDWIAYQRECFPTIDGVLLLDDIVGFVGPRDFDTFVLPYLSRAFDTDVSVKFFHNDAPSKVCAPRLHEAGINLFNFGYQYSLAQMKEWTAGKVTLLGNIPTREVLASGTPEVVASTVSSMLEPIEDRSHIIVSCGGGMPPGVPSENIRALIEATAEATGRP